MREFARSLARGSRGSRLGRLAAVFSFVAHLVDVPPPEPDRPRDGVDVLLGLVGGDEGPAVILAALLQALGERAGVEWLPPGPPFVRVQIDAADLARLPPYAGVRAEGQRLYIPLDPRRARTPVGFLPKGARGRWLDPFKN